MSFDQILGILQIIIAGLFMAAILVQKRGASLGGAFGGSSESYYTKRGAERMVFLGSIFLAVLFLGVSLLRSFV